jgi:hypothetical protein
VAGIVALGVGLATRLACWAEAGIVVSRLGFFEARRVDMVLGEGVSAIRLAGGEQMEIVIGKVS